MNALLVLTDPGDEVILTDPTYAGMLQRVRLVGTGAWGVLLPDDQLQRRDLLPAA